jgi:hypothetical protein
MNKVIQKTVNQIFKRSVKKGSELFGIGIK